MNRLRPQPWPWRQSPRWARPYTPPAPLLGLGEEVAYTVSRHLGPLRAIVLEAEAGWARLAVTWLPTQITTERSVPLVDLRPWTPADDDYWAQVKARRLTAAR